MGEPLPLLIGVMYTPFLEVPPEDPQHKVIADWFDWAVRKVRLGMATFAQNEGFNLREVIEIPGDDRRSRTAYKHLWDRMGSTEAAAILIHGNVSLARVYRVAVNAGARVYELPPVFPIMSTNPWEEQ